MYCVGMIHTDARKLEMAQASLKAAEHWRFRNLQSKERKVLAAILTTVFSLFVR